MVKNVIPAGRYEIVIATVADATTRAEHYMRRFTAVVIGQAMGIKCDAGVSRAEYIGGVLYGFAVFHDPAAFFWMKAVEHPADLDVGQRFNATVVQEQTERWGWVNRIKSIEVRPGDDMPPNRDLFVPEPEPVDCDFCHGEVGGGHPAGCPGEEGRGPAREIRRESASRRSAMEQDRERIEQTVDNFLFETAAPEPNFWPTVGGNRGHTGVVFPDAGIQGGVILMSGFARQLGAHLIRAADLHDEIQEAGR